MVAVDHRGCTGRVVGVLAERVTWADIILEALRHHGGEASVSMVIQYVEDHGLTGHGYAARRGYVSSYRRSVRGILSRMGKKGTVVNVKPGVWRIA